jgi:hypothetical protein
MTDAHDESVESVESLDDAIASELAAQEERSNPPEEAPEAPQIEETEEVVAEEAPEEPTEPSEEEKLTPYDHWKAEYREGFSEMSRKQQELWLQREKEFEDGIRSKGQELSQAKRFVGELHQIIQPMVNDWARQGLQPASGIRRAIALEQALRDDPQNAIMSLAKERGVDLSQAWAEQPYQDPAVSQLEKQLSEQRRQMDEWRRQQEHAQQQQLEQQRQQAYGQILEMKEAKDESGNLKFPHLEYVMSNMAQALESGRARSLESAYSQAVQELRNHPVIRDSLARETQQTTTQRKAEAEKAKAASRAVDSNSTGTANQPKTLDQDILEALEANGL